MNLFLHRKIPGLWFVTPPAKKEKVGCCVVMGGKLLIPPILLACRDPGSDKICANTNDFVMAWTPDLITFQQFYQIP